MARRFTELDIERFISDSLEDGLTDQARMVTQLRAELRIERETKKMPMPVFKEMLQTQFKLGVAAGAIGALAIWAAWRLIF